VREASANFLGGADRPDRWRSCVRQVRLDVGRSRTISRRRAAPVQAGRPARQAETATIRRATSVPKSPGAVTRASPTWVSRRETGHLTRGPAAQAPARLTGGSRAGSRASGTRRHPYPTERPDALAGRRRLRRAARRERPLGRHGPTPPSPRSRCQPPATATVAFPAPAATEAPPRARFRSAPWRRSAPDRRLHAQAPPGRTHIVLEGTRAGSWYRGGPARRRTAGAPSWGAGRLLRRSSMTG
jgi:hypothetical protein